MTAKLIIIRGLPSSGKSTLAKNMSDYYHVETDQFWKNEEGEYKFDVTRLKEAHAWCQNTVKSLLEKLNDSPVLCTYFHGVVVANTFTQRWEMEPYFQIARDLGIVPQIVTCYGNFGGNIHNVPQEVLNKMKDRFEHDVTF